jgi:hypothetical protein
MFGEPLTRPRWSTASCAMCASARRCRPGRMDRAAGRAQVRPWRVPKEELQAALANLPAEQRAALELAADRVRRFHQAQPVTSWMTQSMGGTLGQYVRPSGGWASTSRRHRPAALFVLMSAVPAQVAGVKEIVLVAPPDRATGEHRPDHPGSRRPDRHRRSVCGGWGAGHRRAGLRHRQHPRSIKSSARATCSSPWPSARCTAWWASTAWPARPRRWSSPMRAPARLGGRRPAGPGRARCAGRRHPADPSRDLIEKVQVEVGGRWKSAAGRM